MEIQTLDPHHFNQKARQIRTHVPAALTRRGLLPKFASWRLSQDPSTGLVVLFGILNDQYIAAHTQTPSGAYFDPRLLQDLAADLQVQVIPSNSDGLRYAFILDRGHLGQVTTSPGFPDLQPGPLLAQEHDSHRPVILMQGEGVVLAGSNSSTVARRAVYRVRADDFQPVPMAQFAPPRRYPESLSRYIPTPVVESSLGPLPRLLLVLEEYNDLLRSLCGSAEELALAVASFARVGRKWGVNVLVSAPEWTAK